MAMIVTDNFNANGYSTIGDYAEKYIRDCKSICIRSFPAHFSFSASIWRILEKVFPYSCIRMFFKLFILYLFVFIYFILFCTDEFSGAGIAHLV
jgi:hypothetical protein